MCKCCEFANVRNVYDECKDDKVNLPGLQDRVFLYSRNAVWRKKIKQLLLLQARQQLEKQLLLLKWQNISKQKLFLLTAANVLKK